RGRRRVQRRVACPRARRPDDRGDPARLTAAPQTQQVRDRAAVRREEDMSQNPFDALSGGPGGLDLGALMKQAQQMQSDMMEAQQRLAEAEVDGSVAGGAVKVTLTGAGELTGVTIAPEALEGHDRGDVEAL